MAMISEEIEVTKCNSHKLITYLENHEFAFGRRSLRRMNFPEFLHFSNMNTSLKLSSPSSLTCRSSQSGLTEVCT